MLTLSLVFKMTVRLIQRGIQNRIYMVVSEVDVRLQCDTTVSKFS